MSDWDNREILRRLGLMLASDPTPSQRRALAQIAALETEHEPANDERTSFEVEEIAVALAEAMDEVRREPRTSLWRSFWDRLTEGGEAPGWPFEDEEPVHLVAAPSPTGDRERQIELIAAELRREPSRLNTIEERAEALLDALGAISSGDREREALRAAIRDVLLDTGLLTGDGQPLGEGHVLDQVIEQIEHRAADPADFHAACDGKGCEVCCGPPDTDCRCTWDEVGGSEGIVRLDPRCPQHGDAAAASPPPTAGEPDAADNLLHPPSSGEQEGEVCKSCHRPVVETCPTYWQADDDLWNEVEGGPAGIRCIPCFTRDAQARGILISWRAIREATAGEVADAPAETQEEER